MKSRLLSRRPASRPNRRSRDGFTTIEVLITAIAIGAAMLITVSAVAAVQRNRRVADHVQFAAQELSNQLERATALKWEELTPKRLAELKLSEQVPSRIPDARLTLAVTEVSEPRRAKKLEARIHWPDRDQGIRPTLRLTAWVFAQGESP